MAKRSPRKSREKSSRAVHIPGHKIVNGIPIPEAGILPSELFAMLAEALGALPPGAGGPGGLPVARRAPKDGKWLEAQTLVEAADGLDPVQHATEREILARKALRLSEDHAEAWCVLADQATNADDAVAAYRGAVEAGERFLGKTLLARFRGAVGAVPGGAGLLRAQRGLVDSLSASGRVREAIDASGRLLDLDERDPASVRPFLLALTIDDRRWDEARCLLAGMHDDDGAHVPWGRALLEFGEFGDVVSARAALELAVKVNRHVAEALLGDEPNRRGRAGACAHGGTPLCRGVPFHLARPPGGRGMAPCVDRCGGRQAPQAWTAGASGEGAGSPAGVRVVRRHVAAGPVAA